MILTHNSIDIANIGNGKALSSDTCNSEQKSCWILVQLIEKQYGIVHEVDCVQHVRCVYFNGAAKAVSEFLTTYLEDSLDKISRFLCVSPYWAQVIWAYHKEFSLTENYPKGDRKR